MELEETIVKLDEIIKKTISVIDSDIECRVISVYNSNKDNLGNFWKALCVELSDKIPCNPELADKLIDFDKETSKCNKIKENSYSTVYHFILNIANFSEENYLWDFAKSIDIEKRYGKLIQKNLR